MKLLLTGNPGCGKTTLLEDFINSVSDKQGFIAKETREDAVRTGFKLVPFIGQAVTLANVSSTSKIKVSSYGVEVEQLSKFISKLPPIKLNALLYIDEIGQMELFSKNFKNLVTKYLNSKNHFVGTITSAYRDNFTKQILDRDDIILLKVTPDNREQIRNILNGLAKNIHLLQKLSPAILDDITKMAKQYANNFEFIQLNKLFKNTVLYLAEHRLEKVGTTKFKLKGNQDEHMIEYINDKLVCDCDLFNGVGIFKNKPGECSHIQTVKLTNLGQNRF